MMRHGFRTLIFGALVISVLIFIILPWQFPGFSAKPYLNKVAHLNFNFSDINPAHKIVKDPANPDSHVNMVRTDRLIYIPIVAVGLVVVAYSAFYIFVRSKNKILAKQMAYFKVIPFGTFELKDIGIAKGFLISLAQNLRNPWDAIIMGQPWFRYILKKNAGDGLVEIYFGVPADRTQPFINSFTGYYDNIQLKQLTEAQAEVLIPNHKRYKISSFATLTKDPLPIKMYGGETSQKDPLEIIIAGMGGGKPSDVDLIVDVLMKPIPEYKNLYQVGANYITKMRDERFDETDVPSILSDQGPTGKKAPKKTLSDYEKDYIKVVKERCTAPEKAFKTSIKIYAGGQGDILMALKSASDSFASLNAFNSLVSEVVYDPWRMKKKILEGRFGVHEGFTLSSGELVGFVRVPDNTLNCFAFIDTIDSQIVRAPQSIASENVTPEDMYLVDSQAPIQVNLNEHGDEVEVAQISQQKQPAGNIKEEIISDVMEIESGMGDMSAMIEQYRQIEAQQQPKLSEPTQSIQQAAPAPSPQPIESVRLSEPPWEDSTATHDIVTHVIKDGGDDDDGFNFD